MGPTFALKGLQDRILRARAKASIEELRGQQAPAISFFILSSGRSGSTLLRRMLDMHPALTIPPESGDAITSAAKVYLGSLRRPWEERLENAVDAFFEKPDIHFWGLEPDRIKKVLRELPGRERNFDRIVRGIYEAYCHEVAEKKVDLLGDKTPFLLFRMKWMKFIFPDSLYIFMVRDGRDVVNSMVKRKRRGLSEACRRWVNAMRIVERYSELRGLNTCVLRYEDMVQDPGQELSRLFERLEVEDLSDDPRFVGGVDHELGDTVMDHHAKVKESVSPSNIGLWREEMSSKEVSFVEERLTPELRRWGYSA